MMGLRDFFVPCGRNSVKSKSIGVTGLVNLMLYKQK